MEERKRTTIRIPEELHKAARLHSFKAGTTLTEIVTKLLSAYIDTQEENKRRVMVDLPSWAAGEKGDRTFLTIENLKNLTALGNNENEAS